MRDIALASQPSQQWIERKDGEKAREGGRGDLGLLRGEGEGV